MRFKLAARPVLLAVLVLGVCLVSGCGDSVTQPAKAISLDQIPVELGKAFGSANPDAKEFSDQAVAAVQSKDFSKASVALETLSKRPDLNKIQSRTVAGAAIAVNAALLEAESKGDQQAAETLNIRRLTK